MILYHIILYYIILCYIILYYIILYYIIVLGNSKLAVLIAYCGGYDHIRETYPAN